MNSIEQQIKVCIMDGFKGISKDDNTLYVFESLEDNNVIVSPEQSKQITDFSEDLLKEIDLLVKKRISEFQFKE